jgi:hypothetical protein
VATQIIDFAVYDLRIDALNSDGHASIFGIMSLVAELAMAMAAWFRGLHSDKRGSWLVLAALAAPLSRCAQLFPDSPPRSRRPAR